MTLQDLLSVYETALARGDAPTPEAICHAHPELLEPFRQHARAIAAIAPPGAADFAAAAVSTHAVGPALQLQDCRPHARGGLGEVYKAHDPHLQRDVALKVMTGPADAARRARFEREAAITAKLEHPGVVPIHGTATDDRGRPGHVMRFVSGPTLHEAIEQFHASNPTWNRSDAALRQLFGRLVQVAQTIAFAHSRGIIHRDLKPGNVILGDYGETIVIDWGLAKDMNDSVIANTSSVDSSDDARTQDGAVIGTPAYLSPEQARGAEATPATDIYALGGLLFSVLTNTAPFGDMTFQERFARLERGDIPSARSRNAAAPAGLDAICTKAMAAAPGDRYADARTFAADLDRWLADEPVAAHPDPLGVRVRRFVRRHQKAATAAAALLVAATVGLAVGAVLLGNEQRKTSKALDAETVQRTKAETKEAETASVLGFVERRIFEAGRPKGRPGGLGRDVKLADAVVAALPHVAGSFAGQPLTEARLHITLGGSLLHLGDYKTAERQYAAARTLYEAHAGPDHPDTLACLHNLAISYAALGREKEAHELREQTLARRQTVLGPEHADTLASMHTLANSYDALGRYQDALALREKTLALRQATLGSDHSDTLLSLNGLASSFETLGRYADAAKLCEQALALQKAKLGPDHVDTLRSMNNLANNYDDLGRKDDAMTLRQEVRDRRRATLGPEHPDTLAAMHNLAGSYYSLGRHEDARRQFEECLVLRRLHLGPSHPHTLQTLNNLAATNAILGRHEEALKLHGTAVELKTAKHGADHPDTLVSKSNLAATLSDLERHDDAVKLREEVFKLRTAKLGADHPDTLSSQRWLAESLVKVHRGSEAVPLIDACLGRAKDPRLLQNVALLRVRHFAGLKDAAGSRATAEMFEKRNLADAASLVTAARLRVVAGDADAAMTWLTKAVAAGFKDAASLAAEVDLAPLRTRDDYRKLVTLLNGASP